MVLVGCNLVVVRMELNAVRHAMQIRDAPGITRGKKLRLTRLYQLALKGLHVVLRGLRLTLPISVAVQSSTYTVAHPTVVK